MTGSCIPLQDLKDVLDQALCVCAMMGALLIALVELEWERLVALIRFTHYWIGRAVLQVRETRPSSPPPLRLHPRLEA